MIFAKSLILKWVPVKVAKTDIGPIIHPNQLQFRPLWVLSWPTCPCGSGGGIFFFWDAQLAELSPVTGRKERNGQVAKTDTRTPPRIKRPWEPPCKQGAQGNGPGGLRTCPVPLVCPRRVCGGFTRRVIWWVCARVRGTAKITTLPCCLSPLRPCAVPSGAGGGLLTHGKPPARGRR
jgi:hypothetical protein